MSLDKERAALVDDISKGAYALLKENNFNGEKTLAEIKAESKKAFADDERTRAKVDLIYSRAIELICKYRKTKTSATAHQ